MAPCRDHLTPRQLDELVSALSLVIGWEAFIVLADVRGLPVKKAREITLRSALAILDAALSRPG